MKTFAVHFLARMGFGHRITHMAQLWQDHHVNTSADEFNRDGPA